VFFRNWRKRSPGKEGNGFVNRAKVLPDNNTVPVVSKEGIQQGLEDVGLAKGDVVFVHSSLSSFGRVEGGADAVVDALLETVGAEGTVVMPTFTWDAFHDKERVVFDVAKTPCETGAIPEALRKRPAVMRSPHICHSVAALGLHAKDVMGDGRSPFGQGSTFARLYDLDCQYLFLGVGFSACTALHMVEEFMQVPYRYYRDFAGSTVRLPDGTEMPSRSVEFLKKPGYRNDLAKTEPIFSAAGILRVGQVGKARIIATTIRQIFDLTLEYLKQDIGFLLTKESRQLLRAREDRHDR